MSGLAEILLNRHFTVTGSDMQASDMTKHLEETGAKVVIGQKAENITDDIDLVVYTAAIHESNEEFAAAKNKGIPMMTRAALLGQIMANFAKSIAVAGTHGKTTTTSMLDTHSSSGRYRSYCQCWWYVRPYRRKYPRWAF
mgnify:CR=1 FL=1